jgi:hypothetical protein
MGRDRFIIALEIKDDEMSAESSCLKAKKNISLCPILKLFSTGI